MCIRDRLVTAPPEVLKKLTDSGASPLVGVASKAASGAVGGSTQGVVRHGVKSMPSLTVSPAPWGLLACVGPLTLPHQLSRATTAVAGVSSYMA